MQMNLLLMQLCAIAFALVVQGSAGFNISPSPATFSVFPPLEEGRSALVHQGKSLISNGPSPASRPNGSSLHPPLVLPPLKSAPVPQSIKGPVPSLSLSMPTRLPPYSLAPPSLSVQGTAPSVPPGASQKKALHNRAPVLVPVAPVPVVSPSKNFPKNSPTVHPIMPGSQPPVASPSKNFPQNSPTVRPIMPGSLPPVASSSKKLPQNSPTAHPIMPGSLSPSAHRKKAPENENPLSVPVAPAPVALPPRKLRRSPSSIQPVMPGALPPILPVASPSKKLPQNSPTVHPIMPPSAHQGKAPENEVPISVPVAPAPVALPPRKLRRSPPSTGPIMPGLSPPMLPVPVASPPSKSPVKSPSIHPIPREPPSTLPDPNASPISTPPPSINSKRDGMPVAAPPNGTPNSLSPVNHYPSRGSFPVVAPATHKAVKHSDGASAPAPSLVYRKSPPHKRFHSPASSPLASFYKHHHARNIITSLAPASSYLVPPHASKQGPVVPPAPLYPPKFLPKSRQRHNAPPPLNPGSSVSPSHSPFPSSASHASPAPSPSPTAPSGYTESVPILAPKISPSGSSPRNPKTPLRPPVLALPPPPPNIDCTSIVCTEPLTNTPPGSPCGCVFPMQVGLRLSVALYTFFPLVSNLAEEIAAGVFIKQSQVRIIGANAASQQPEKTIVLIDLVPLGEKFDNTTAFLIFQRFWLKQVAIEASFFGDYEVLYVRYPGLPPSPPMAPSSIIVDDGAYSGHDNNGRTIHPLGVNVRGMRHKEGLSGSVIAIIALSSSIAVVLCSACAWVLLLKRRDRVCQPTPTPQALLPTLSRPSGITGSMLGSGPTSASLSFGSSIATYTGAAKTFSSSEIEKATDNFDASRVLGEGGFGRVYSGVLEDGTQVAVKVLKRDDQQGGREFLAEVEMLSRLHHRNLVKLIGICTEEHRCLVYELIPNGSVESHLHGVDKNTSPLDWGTRLKVALGAARGLAYLHEDSSPGVIHRDFKSSNILLEHDFTPKVSDFGLARTALDGENRHISTRVMGTFGYVAPEYAMTGHLLVKSDVYSYGVVLLELLSGRKPVDMSQPPGQENLVAWARPLLTSKEGLETIIDPSLGSDFPFDSVAKVSAIASMCVQPEVTHRPFMGEVVQALKLVCNECDETKEAGSRRGSISCSQGDFSIDMDARISAGSGLLPDTSQTQFPVPNYDSDLDTETRLSVSDLFSTSVRLGRQASGSFRRHASSSPLRTGRGRQFWQRMRRLSGGSVSEHGIISRMWPGSH